jgi:AraC family transcriptional regulator
MKNVSCTGVRQHTANEYTARVCRAMDFISQNLDRDLSLKEIARAGAMGRTPRISEVMRGVGSLLG